MPLAKFRIVSEPGSGSVEVNGAPVGDQVSGLVLRAGHDQIPVLTLEMFGEGTIEGEGVVEVARTAGPDDLSAVAAWIRGLDAAALGSQAANQSGLGGSTAGVLLGIVADLLDGHAT